MHARAHARTRPTRVPRAQAAWRQAQKEDEHDAELIPETEDLDPRFKMEDEHDMTQVSPHLEW